MPGAPTLVASGSGAGTFSDTVTETTTSDLVLGQNGTYVLSVNLTAAVPIGGSGSVNIDIPSHSLDLTLIPSSQGAAPEPASALLALPALALLSWRRTGRTRVLDRE